MVQGLTLEALLVSVNGFGLTTASPLQRACCRIADGLELGDLADVPEVRAAVGDVDALPTVPPSEMLILSGIRTAKSLFAAATAVRASQTCDLSGLGAGETPRVSVVSLTVDLGRVVFDHIVGNVMAKPALRALMLGEPTTDTIVLRHPTGRPVEIKVCAGARAGSSLVARWSAGCIFDEAPRMIGADDGVVNFDDCRRAVIGRLLPGAQIISIGSPWAPFGPIYERVMERQGKPGPDLVIIRAPAHVMNPVTWTPERVEELRVREPQVYLTDVLGEFADPISSMFGSVELEKVTRKEPAELEPEAGHHYVATMDAGTRSNAWTLAVATVRLVEGRLVRTVVLARQWQGSRLLPLDPDVVLAEIAALLKPYRVTHVTSDAWSLDALRAVARRYGLGIIDKTVTTPMRLQLYETMRMLVASREIEFPPDPVVRADLVSVRKRVTQSGISIELPRSSDGRHADFAPALALLASEPISAPARKQEGPPVGSPEWWAVQLAKEKADASRHAAGVLRKQDRLNMRRMARGDLSWMR
jgi:hypothetical protein